MTLQQMILTVLILAVSAVVIYLTFSARNNDVKNRPVFRTALDLDQMDAHIRTRRFEDGERACREVLKKNPGDHEAKCYLASCLAAQNRHDEASAILLEEATLPHPRDPWVFAQLGFLFAEQGQMKLSAWALDRGLSLFPRYTELLVSRARLYLEENDAIRALGYAEQALLEAPDDYGALWAKMLALEMMGSYEEAEGTLEHMRELDPEGNDLSLQLVHIRMQQEHYEEALELCSRELMMSPKDPSLYRARAMVYTKCGKFEEALSQLERAKELGAEGEQLDLEMLEPLCGAGRVGEAYAILDGIIRANSPVTEHFLGEGAKTEYPILTSQTDFASFLEERRKF